MWKKGIEGSPRLWMDLHFTAAMNPRLPVLSRVVSKHAAGRAARVVIDSAKAFRLDSRKLYAILAHSDHLEHLELHNPEANSGLNLLKLHTAEFPSKLGSSALQCLRTLVLERVPLQDEAILLLILSQAESLESLTLLGQLSPRAHDWRLALHRLLYLRIAEVECVSGSRPVLDLVSVDPRLPTCVLLFWLG